MIDCIKRDSILLSRVHKCLLQILQQLLLHVLRLQHTKRSPGNHPSQGSHMTSQLGRKDHPRWFLWAGTTRQIRAWDYVVSLTRKTNEDLVDVFRYWYSQHCVEGTPHHSYDHISQVSATSGQIGYEESCDGRFSMSYRDNMTTLTLIHMYRNNNYVLDWITQM